MLRTKPIVQGPREKALLAENPSHQEGAFHRIASGFSGFSIPEVCIRLVLGMYFSIGSTYQVRAVLNGLMARPALVGQGFPETTIHSSWILLCEHPEPRQAVVPHGSMLQECIVQGNSVS